MRKKILTKNRFITILIFLNPVNNVMANSLLDLTDDQFKRLLSRGISDKCVEYYLGDINDLSSAMDQLKIIDTPGHAARLASKSEQDMTLNYLLETLEKRCFQDVKRAIVTHNFYKDMPKHLEAEDFSDRRVLDRYIDLIGFKNK